MLNLTAIYDTSGDPSLVPSHLVRWRRGEDGSIQVNVTDDAGAAVNITGASVVMTCRRLEADAAPLFARAAVLTQPLLGIAIVTLTAADTDGLSSGPYRFDVWLLDTNGRHQIIRPGGFIVMESDSRIADTPGYVPPVPAILGGSVDTIAELGAVDASNLTDFFAMGVRGTDGGPSGYYHIRIGLGKAVDGVTCITALNLTNGQWLKGLGDQ